MGRAHNSFGKVGLGRLVVELLASEIFVWRMTVTPAKVIQAERRDSADFIHLGRGM